VSDSLSPDDNSVTARLIRMERRQTDLERRLSELEDRALFPRLALPAPKGESHGRTT
jgi:hypothetical protein